MSDTHNADSKALIVRIFDEVINNGRMDAIDEMFTEDFLDHGPTGDMSGRDTFRQLVEQWREAVPDVHCVVEHIVAEGDIAGWTVRTTGTHTGDALGFPATGKRFETVSANIGRLRDGRAAEHWSEQGMLPMLIQIGIMPAPVPAPA